MDDTETTKPDESNDEEQTFKRLKRWFKESQGGTSEWRKMAKEDFDFRAGHQWTKDEIQLLQDQLRPVVTFNRIDPVLSAVEGTQLQNRQEIKYSPRQMGALKTNEILSSASDWMRDQCDAEFDESDAFSDLITCGLGWVEGNVDFVDNPEGKYIENAIDPLEMFWDMASRKKNLSGARFVFRAKKMPKIEAKENHPEADEEILNASWADMSENDAEGEKKNPKDSYSGDPNDEENDQDDVIIVEAQWWEKETFYSVLDPADGQLKETKPDEFKLLQKRYEELGQPMPQNVRRQRKVYRQAFLGSKIIEMNTLDCQQFKYKAMTGKRDKNKNVYYGLVRGMKDPQRWANKWLSQTMHIVNSNAKGGMMVEVDAVPNVREFEENWSRPDKTTWLNPGGLAKLQQKAAIVFPAGLEGLMQFAISSIRDTSGVSLELLGMADRDQPGILERQRKQAGLTILAHMFDSMRLMHREMGRLRLFYIQNYLSDGRLVRVVGQDMAQYVPLVRDQTIGEYDVIVDESPTSPNQKEDVFSVLMQVLPGLMKMGVAVPPDVLDYMPLPSSLTDKWKQYIEQQKQAAAQQPDPHMAKVQGELAIKGQAEQAHVQIKQQAADAHTEIKAGAAQAQTQIQSGKAQADARLKEFETMSDIYLQEQKQAADEKLQHQKYAGEVLGNLLKPTVVIDKGNSSGG